jgi:hypothetical protein
VGHRAAWCLQICGGAQCAASMARDDCVERLLCQAMLGDQVYSRLRDGQTDAITICNKKFPIACSIRAGPTLSMRLPTSKDTGPPAELMC